MFLVEGAAQQSFLLQLSDKFQTTKCPNKILSIALSDISRYFKFDRAIYGECQEADGSIAIRHEHTDSRPRMDRFSFRAEQIGTSLASLASGVPRVVGDTSGENSSDRLKELIGEAFVSIPINRAEHPLAVFHFCLLNKSDRPAFNFSLLHEAVERTFVAMECARAKELLGRSEQRFRALTFACSDVVYTMNPDWTEMRQLYGKDFINSADEINTNWFDDYIPPDEAESVKRAIDEALRGGEFFHAEHRVKRIDGSIGWTVSRAIPIRDDDGEIVEWFGAASDVTKKKSDEVALASANALLMNADKRKDDFLAMLSHELRNPLSSIVNTLSVLEQESPAGSNNTRSLGILQRQTSQLCRLVEDLLDIRRISMDKVNFNPHEVDLTSLLSESIDDFRALFHGAGVALEVSLPSAALYVYGDYHRLIQVMSNLFNNALKFTSRGGQTWIKLSHDDDRKQAVIHLGDDGVGIEPDVLPSIFESFAQGETTGGCSNDGFGLGLALVKRIMALHSGEISAHSGGAGRGSEFILKIPLLTAAASLLPEKSVQTDKGSDSTSHESRTKRVLIIEDIRDVAESLSEVLMAYRYDVAVAYDGRSGIAMALRQPPDVVLCDIGLPGMSGYEVARYFRTDAKLKDVSMVALSGYAQPADVDRAKGSGFDFHLSKPASIASLTSVLAEL